MIDYPENLPQPSTSLSADAETPTVRTDLDNGLVEQFGRFATGRETFSATWELSQAELVIFEEWFNETLAGGVLIFGMMLPEDDGYSIQPVRFVGGEYAVAHKGSFFWNVTARIEKMIVSDAPANRTLPIPQWLRLAVDEAISQNLTLAHRNALLTVRPDFESQTTLRIYPPTDETQYIYFGINNQGDGETLITSEDVDPLPAEAVPSWPGSLPNVNQSFRLAAKRNAARLEFDSGHTRQYAQGDATTKGQDVDWNFTLEQLQTFQDFFYITLKGGSLPCWLTLPVDGQFIPVPVRWVGGRYSESYIFHDTFRVSGRVERIVDQTVLPTVERPFPMYYGPTVNVASHIRARDAQGKFFILNPPEGQTVNIHIYDTNPEFGLLIVGLGNVLITRSPFIVEMDLVENGIGEYKPIDIELKDVVVNIGALPGDNGLGEFLLTSFELRNLSVNLGALPGDNGLGEFAKPSLEILDVLNDIGSLPNESGSGEFILTSFELAIP